MKSSAVKMILASIVLFGIHFSTNLMLPEPVQINAVYQVHLFLGIATTLIVFVLEKIRARSKTSFGQAYLVSVVLKMFASIAFLLPKIIGENEGEKLFVIHFFAAFFIYLFLEVYFLVSKLKKHP